MISSQSEQTKQELNMEKKMRTDTLDALLLDTANRAAKPLDTLSTQLALYVGDGNGSFDKVEAPKQRGAQRDVLNAPVYRKMLEVVNDRLDSYLPTKLKTEKGRGQTPVYRNELDLSPLRMLTEHRRKLLLKSLCGFNDISDDRDSATVGVENSFNLRDYEVLTLPEEKVAKYFPSNNNVHKRAKISPSQSKTFSKKEEVFIPKWDHYDVMRHRWISLQPATKRLVVDVEDYMPTSSVDNSMRVDSMNEPIQGRFIDSINFDQTIQSIVQSKESRGTRSRSLVKESEAAFSRGGLSTTGSRKSSVYSNSMASQT